MSNQNFSYQTRPERLTRGAFERFMLTEQVRVLVPAPYDLAPCDCGDVNCHGWRFVPRARTSPALSAPRFGLLENGDLRA